MKKDLLLSNKQKDLAALGVGNLYSACYCFSFSSFATLVGLSLALCSTRYSDFAAWLTILLFGLALIAAGMVVFAFSVLAYKKKQVPVENPVLLCPITSWKVIRNGYCVSSILLAIGWILLTIGLLHFPSSPVAGVSLFAVSLIVLLYGRLLLLATIRDHLLRKHSLSH